MFTSDINDYINSLLVAAHCAFWVGVFLNIGLWASWVVSGEVPQLAVRAQTIWLAPVWCLLIAFLLYLVDKYCDVV